MNIPDIIYTEVPLFPSYINQVGVNNVKVPFKIKCRDSGYKEMIANVTMSCDLDENIKGISMSRFIRTLNDYLDVPLNQKIVKNILEDFSANNNKSNNTFIKFSFELPKNKISPSSKLIFPEYYKCSFSANLNKDKDRFSFFENVIVQYASYCPCSSALCNDLKQKNLNGFPHAQRSYAELLIEVKENEIVWLEDLIDLVEYSVKNIPYPIIKREDEQFLANIASENTMFVEDSIRSIKYVLNKEEKIKDWILKCNHEESIHTSNAFSICWKGIENGFSLVNIF